MKGENDEKENRKTFLCTDFSNNDISVMVIGTKVKDDIYIINVFQGEEAEELYQKLTVKKEGI